MRRRGHATIDKCTDDALAHILALVALTSTHTARTWTRTTPGDYLSNVCLGCLCTLWMQVRLISVLACFSSAQYIASWTFTNSGCACNSILHSPHCSHNNQLWHIIITLVRSSECVATASAPCAPKCAHVYEREQLKARKNAWKRVQASVKAQEWTPQTRVCVGRRAQRERVDVGTAWPLLFASSFAFPSLSPVIFFLHALFSMTTLHSFSVLSILFPSVSSPSLCLEPSIPIFVCHYRSEMAGSNAEIDAPRLWKTQQICI